MSGVVLFDCPLCNVQLPLEELQIHSNKCLDQIVEKEQSMEGEPENSNTELSDSTGADIDDTNPDLNDWVILNTKPKTFSSGLGIRKKLKAVVYQNKDSAITISDFYKVEEAGRPPQGWIGDELIDKRLVSECGEDLTSIQTRKDLWKSYYTKENRKSFTLKEKYALRKGISYQARNRVWKILTDVRNSSERNPNFFTDTYEAVFGEIVPATLLTVPTFSGKLIFSDSYLNEYGINAAKRLLCSIHQNHFELDYCPVLCEIIPILLSFLNETDSLYAVEWMIKTSMQRQLFFGCSKKQYAVQNMVFGELLKSKNSSLYSHMSNLSIEVSDFSSAWFERLFVGFLPFDSVLRVFDVYLNEGKKILYRVGLAILDSAASILQDCSTKEIFLSTLACAGSHFIQHDALMTKAFRYIIMQMNLKSLEENCEKVASGLGILEPQFQLFYRPKFPPSEIIDPEKFEILYSWLPERNRLQDPTRLFISNQDGFSLRELVSRSAGESPTILLIRSTCGTIFGVFVTGEWQQSNQIFGTAEMFLFVLHPTPNIYRAQADINTQYIRVSHTELQVGQGRMGIGLSIDDDLNKGYSDCSSTYQNDPLVGVSDSENHEFTVGLVELWSFI